MSKGVTLISVSTALIIFSSYLQFDSVNKFYLPRAAVWSTMD
jgi:hypothetical protein